MPGGEQSRTAYATEVSATIMRRSVGSPRLFAIIWTSLASAIYFALGVATGHALGLTPLVFILAGFFFSITAMTYVEGAALHPDRAGATVFARYAFNELWSFIAGWAIMLDFVILCAVASLTATRYLATFFPGIATGSPRTAVTLGIIAFVVVSNVRGFSARRARRIAVVVIVDLLLQLLVVVVGLVLFFNPSSIIHTIHLGTVPRWSDVIYAFTITAIAFTSLESASGLSGEVAVSRSGLRRLIASANLSIYVIYAGIALVAVSAIPIVGGHSPLGGSSVNAPMVTIVERFHPHWLADVFRYSVAGAAAAILIAAANSAMLGLSRLGYSLATHRQIPSAIGRLHPQRSSPYVLIGIAALIAAALAAPGNLDLLVGIYAFGAMLAFTIAHVSVCVLRFREPDRPRPYRMKISVRVRGGSLPLPAVLGALMSFAAWISVIVLHSGARYVGAAWLGGGLLIYVVYRRMLGLSLFTQVNVPAAALSVEPAEREYGSILVPLVGTPLDDDLIHTAALLVASKTTDEAAVDRSTIEAIWILEVPMTLPLDASLPAVQLRQARAAVARAKEVGEEYTGVQVATAVVRARRRGYAIVEEARRRGVEVIILAAEEPPRIGGGALLGARATVGESAIGAMTRYVIAKAPCRVLLTAPSATAATVLPA